MKMKQSPISNGKSGPPPRFARGSEMKERGARHPGRRGPFAVFVILLAFVAAGCGSLFPPLAVEEPGQGDLHIAVRMAAMTKPSGGTIRVDLYTVAKPKSTDKPRIVHEVPLDAFDGTIRLRHIAALGWYVHMRLFDADGIVLYEGSGAAVTRDGETSRIALDLHPAPGELVVTISLGDECIYVGGNPPCLHEARRLGRLVVNKGLEEDEIKYDFNLDEGQTGITLPPRPLPPGTYDFRVTFYHTSRINANELLGNMYYGLEIRPGRATAVTWRPDLGTLDMEITVLSPPDPPQNVELVVGADGDRLLRWDPPGERAIHYVVYVKGVGQDWFCHVAETDEPFHRFEGEESVRCFGKETGSVEPELYVVTAVGPGGYESLRSAVVADPGSGSGS